MVFFTADYAGKRFIYERCRQLGVKSVSWADFRPKMADF